MPVLDINNCLASLEKSLTTIAEIVTLPVLAPVPVAVIASPVTNVPSTCSNCKAVPLDTAAYR